MKEITLSELGKVEWPNLDGRVAYDVTKSQRHDNCIRVQVDGCKDARTMHRSFWEYIKPNPSKEKVIKWIKEQRHGVDCTIRTIAECDCGYNEALAILKGSGKP